MSNISNVHLYFNTLECLVDGFVVPKEFIENLTLAQIESLLGFRKKRLDRGAAFAQLHRIPHVEELQYFGDTSIAAHNTSANINKNISTKDLTKAAYSYLTFNTILIKVIPLKDYNPLLSQDENWPSGSGCMQFKLESKVPARIISVINNYPFGRFL